MWCEVQPRRFQNQDKKAQLLKEVPCGSEFSHCKFIKDAYVAVDKLSITKSTCEKLTEEKETVSKDVVDLNPEKIEEHMQKYNQLLNK